MGSGREQKEHGVLSGCRVKLSFLPSRAVEQLTFMSTACLTGMLITIALILIVTSAVEFFWSNSFEVFSNSPPFKHPLHWLSIQHGIRSSIFSCPSPWSCIILPSQTLLLCPFQWNSLGSNRREHERESSSQVCSLLRSGCYAPMQSFGIAHEHGWLQHGRGPIYFVIYHSVSSLEWQLFFSIHIPAVGDWTETLLRAFEQQHSPFPRETTISSPSYTICGDVSQSEAAVLLGEGIGITPFASILKSIWYKFGHGSITLRQDCSYERTTLSLPAYCAHVPGFLGERALKTLKDTEGSRRDSLYSPARLHSAPVLCLLAQEIATAHP
ncbi:NADPH oxidase 1, partial [Galemys pyrenaicus]